MTLMAEGRDHRGETTCARSLVSMKRPHFIAHLSDPKAQTPHGPRLPDEARIKCSSCTPEKGRKCPEEYRNGLTIFSGYPTTRSIYNELQATGDHLTWCPGWGEVPSGLVSCQAGKDTSWGCGHTEKLPMICLDTNLDSFSFFEAG